MLSTYICNSIRDLLGDFSTNTSGTSRNQNIISLQLPDYQCLKRCDRNDIFESPQSKKGDGRCEEIGLE